MDGLWESMESIGEGGKKGGIVLHTITPIHLPQKKQTEPTDSVNPCYAPTKHTIAAPSS
jgi:hypothetical protein